MTDQPIDVDDFYHELTARPELLPDAFEEQTNKYQMNLRGMYQLVSAGRKRFLQVRGFLLDGSTGDRAEEIAQHFLTNPDLARYLTADQQVDLRARLLQGLSTDGEWPPQHLSLTTLLTPCGRNGDWPGQEISDSSPPNPKPHTWLELDPCLVRSLLKSLGESGEPSTGATS